MEFPKHLTNKLIEREQHNALRSLSSKIEGTDFSSNDYLGLASSAVHYISAHERLMGSNALKSGAGGSRLLSGNHALYNEAEAIIAEFHDCEAALIYTSGYTANLGLLGAITSKDCVVLYDALSHASIREAIGFSKTKAYKFAHNDLIDLKRLISKFKTTAKSIFVVTESVFSMDGDSPDLVELATLCKAHNCYLIIDEAHAVGVLGKKGEGLSQQLNVQDLVFARIVTFGKALGGHGAAVLGSKQLTDYLTNFSRPFIYTTALAPITVAGVIEAYEWLKQSDESSFELQKLYRNIAILRSYIIKYRLNGLFIDSKSAIHCCLISGNEQVKELSRKLLANKMDVRAILAPTVPKGQERLRICLHSFNTEAEIIDLIKTIAQFTGIKNTTTPN
jgi:8-amino-7-oxononanoate synthase